MDHHSVEWRVVIFFANFFPASFRQKKSGNFSFFETDLTLPTAFLKQNAHFLQTHLLDPFAYCLAALPMP